MKRTISVVLNVYKRIDVLDLQLESIINQTVKPSKIYIWNNSGKELNLKKYNSIDIITLNSSHNLGVWPRFYFSLNIKEEFIAIIDDDTIPMKKWFENCLNHIGTGNILLGARGLRFLSKHSYTPYESYGWDNPNSHMVEVDIIGHSWFFKKELISVFSKFNDIRHSDDYCGEDIHFSYSIQKKGYKSFIPPHPIEDLDLWGSDPKQSILIGTDNHGVSSKKDANLKFSNAYKHYLNHGFETYYTNHKSPSKITIPNNIREAGFTRFISRFPYLYKKLKSLKKILNDKGIFF